ncbi:hypothetical protein SULI_02480 [Saccharolobus solfataricus]|uniref:Uncharacterized protein n=3 Tax=Saccharolobus solfataricus TaxID=2287 RepID=Q97VE8_SACS2|nr:hypothetical protein [Saccharolobus solfataricus]AAK42796.1 Hypothetical protein SSO2678 [Saccharolobus solfataricus P2]AKA72888.1 hypothetical protein SULB_0485 [Saccharolobus solfataricus]AKA75587.1 hypothetical protein SULC_0483 [Saccharolobus solfataricus]AKA78280.1 hypothetical protein SULA_0483 [Saccharolobus solfataricus]AZF67398.1 hypothetical protein SULG_02480 [Saccharolobus solfataricus]
MQDSLGLLAITLVIVLLFSILIGIIILNHENFTQLYNIQSNINGEILSKAKVGYYWIVEELKNKTISFIPHVYILDTEGVYNIQSVVETTFNGEIYTFPVKDLLIFTNGSLNRNGVILSPGNVIIIRPNITSGQLSFVTNTGNAFSLALLPPSDRTLLPNKSSQNYTVISLGNENILSIRTTNNHLIGPQNITSVELIFNSTPPLYNYTLQPMVNSPSKVQANYYQVRIAYFENVTFIKALDLKDNNSYIIYPGYGYWSGKVYAIGNHYNKTVGSFNISYNTSYIYYKYGSINFAQDYIITFHVTSLSGYVPLCMIVYTYNLTNSNSGFYTVGSYSQLWIKPLDNNSPVYITYSGYSYSYYEYYNFTFNYLNSNNINPIRVGGSSIYLGYLPINITVYIMGNSLNKDISSFQILYNNSQQLMNLPIIMNITYNITSYSPPFLLNFSLTNVSLTVMLNGTQDLPNYTFYTYKLNISIPINESILNINGYAQPIVIPYFIIIVNGKIVGENLPP